MDDQLPRPAAPAVPHTNGFAQDNSLNPLDAVLKSAPKPPVRPDAGLVSNSPIPPAPVIPTPAINDAPQPQPAAMPATDQASPVMNSPQPAPVEPVASPPLLVNNAPVEPVQPPVTASVTDPVLPTPPPADTLVSNQPQAPVVQPPVDNAPVSEPIIFREPDPVAAEPEIPQAAAAMTEPAPTTPELVKDAIETPVAQTPVSSSSDPHQFVPAFQAPTPAAPMPISEASTATAPVDQPKTEAAQAVEPTADLETPVQNAEPAIQNEQPQEAKTEEAPIEDLSAPWEPETVVTPAAPPETVAPTETITPAEAVSPPVAPVVTFDSPVSPPENPSLADVTAPETTAVPKPVTVPPTSPDTPAWLSNQTPVTEMAAVQPQPAEPGMPETAAVDLNPQPVEASQTPPATAESSGWESFLNGAAPDIPLPPETVAVPVVTPEAASPMPQVTEAANMAQPDMANPIQAEAGGGMNATPPMGNPSDQPAGQSEKPVEVNAKSRKPLIFLVILLALFILGSVAALGYKYLTGGSLAAFAPPPQPTLMPQPTQVPPSPTAHPLSSWVPFQSTAFPVSMMYPPEWRHENGNVLESPKETLTGPNSCTLEFAFGSSEGPTERMTEEPVAIDGKAFTKKIWFDEEDRMVLFAYVPENPIPNWEMMTAMISTDDQAVCPETIELMVSTIKFKQTVQGASDEPEPTMAASSSANPSSRSQLISLLLE